jgi:hypothetical protein
LGGESVEVMDLQNGNFKERVVFLMIDSRDRDRASYPSPAHFSFTLDTPVCNVCGLEVVDAQIAKTETNIDEHNNIVCARRTGTSDWKLLKIEPGDYSRTTLTTAIERVLQTIDDIDFASVSCVGGKLIISTGAPIDISMAMSTARWAMGFGDPVEGDLELLTSTSATDDVKLMTRSGFSLLPVQTDWGIVLPALDFDNPFYGTLDIAFSSPLIVGWRITSKVDSNIVYLDSENQNSQIYPGSYSLIFVLDPIRAVVGAKVNISYVRVSNAMIGYTIRSRGIVDLSGTRYVTIRCPEIEPFLFRGMPQSARRMGLAKVALVQAGYNSVSMATSNFSTNRFFPISHLTRLTLTVQREDGERYNLKGVNYTVTIAVHVLQPITMKADEYSGVSTIPRTRAFLPEDMERFQMK